MLLCITFINILVRGTMFETEKRKSFEFWGPRGESVKPRGKIQARSKCPSTDCLPGKHPQLLAFKTRRPVPVYFSLPCQTGLRLYLFFFASESPRITCLGLMMMLIKFIWPVGGFAWQAWCLSFTEISPLLALSTSHSPTQQCRALDTQPVNSSPANYHLWLSYKAGLDSHYCCSGYLSSGWIHLCRFLFGSKVPLVWRFWFIPSIHFSRLLLPLHLIFSFKFSIIQSWYIFVQIIFSFY